jgi:hypothetical protein
MAPAAALNSPGNPGSEGAPRNEEMLSLRIAALATYTLVAYPNPTTRVTEWCVNSTIGLFIQTGTIFRLAIFPIGLAFPQHHPNPGFPYPNRRDFSAQATRRDIEVLLRSK